MWYQDIFGFEAWSKIMNNEDVFMLDRETGDIFQLREEKLSNIKRLLRIAEEDKKGRYSFWVDCIEQEDKSNDAI